MSEIFNFTKHIEAGRLNGTNITGSIRFETGTNKTDPGKLGAFIAVLVILAFIFIAVFKATMALIELMKPRLASAPETPLANVKFVGDLKMNNSPPEKSPMPKQGDGVPVIRT